MATRSAIQVEKSESQAGAPRLTMSLAAFVLVCFFLPWLQVSCFGMQESASGFSLAHEGERELWLAPLAMLLVLFAGLVYSIRRSTLAIFALAGMVGGGLSAWLMFRERAEIGWGTGLISAQWTAWFWLGAAASVASPRLLSAFTSNAPGRRSYFGFAPALSLRFLSLRGQ